MEMNRLLKKENQRDLQIVSTHKQQQRCSFPPLFLEQLIHCRQRGFLGDFGTFSRLKEISRSLLRVLLLKADF